MSPTEGCYQASHALVAESAWRELYGSEADLPQPYRPVTANIDPADVIAAKAWEMQATGDEGQAGDTEVEGENEVAPATD